MKLTSQNVDAVIKDCLYKKDEDPIDAVIVSGVMLNIGFNPIKLKEHEEDILSMLEELPNQFMKNNGGGGWSFLNACIDKNGSQWGEHQDIDALICLGLAINKVEFQMPKAMWSILPGGMPYFSVNNNE